MKNITKMQISIIVGLLASGSVSVFGNEPTLTVIVSLLSGYAIGYFFALSQKK